jgi:aerobic-type carbon monoxide dehydrogenase small subunit (CoxS/CutS family)
MAWADCAALCRAGMRYKPDNKNQETCMISFSLNGKNVQSAAAQDTPLLTILANDLNVNGAKFGCGQAQCGACMVLVNGAALHSCVAPVSAVAGATVITLEGMSMGGQPSRLQQAFIDEQAAQCGYCTSGMIVQAQALLQRNPKPTDAEVRAALDGNLCRCGAHNRIVRAVLRAAKEA